jgi:hypothetical protein
MIGWRVAFRVDHASTVVPDLAAAVEHLDRRVGLRVRVSPEAPERHGRVHLDRSYLEVSAGSIGTAWAATSFFLRFEDPEALRAHLDHAGVQYRFARYEGVDGTWDDVEVRVGSTPCRCSSGERRRLMSPKTGRPRSSRPTDAEPERSPRCMWWSRRSMRSSERTERSLERARAMDDGRAAVGGLAGARTARFASGEVVLHEGGSGAIIGIVLGRPIARCDSNGARRTAGTNDRGCRVAGSRRRVRASARVHRIVRPSPTGSSQRE